MDPAHMSRLGRWVEILSLRAISSSSWWREDMSPAGAWFEGARASEPAFVEIAGAVMRRFG